LLGGNPFIVMMVTTWRRDGTIVGQIVDSGADDVLARPLSTGVLGERIKAQIERRKDFVVTSDYIGPDRRRLSGRDNVECFAVPNALKIKTEEGISEKEAISLLAESVEKGKALLNTEKLRRDAASLSTQWRFLEQRQPDAGDYGDILTRMEHLALDIKRRVSAKPGANGGVSQQKTAAQWCEAVHDSVRRVQAATAGKGAEITVPLENLGHAALTLARMFAAGEAASSTVEVDSLPRREDRQVSI
jgi:hypothetical protein